ncbi:MAG: acyl-[acyl-carrier-protein] thioesterase [Myxococcales bacterium]|jgi:medium-chain acyl-[acyl-carrier-protein] hydrolase
MELVWKQGFRVFAYEVTPRGEARLETLMNYVQEAAGNHAASWKLGVGDLLALGRAWLLSRYHLRVDRYPRLGEEVQVTTWPSGLQEMFALRDFEIALADGAPLAVGTSSWVVFDLEAQQPLPTARALPPEFLLERRALEDSFSRLPGLEAAERSVRLRAMLRDLDLNRHVNHAVYVQWALESAPAELASRQQPTELEVGYRAEALYGDEVVSESREESSGGAEARLVHRICNAQSGVELARARTAWSR